MRTHHILALSLVLACGKGDTDTGIERIVFEDETADTGSVVPLDLTGQKGSLFLVQYNPDAYSDGGYFASGLFTEDNGGMINMAGCLLFAGPCISGVPAEGSSATIVDNFDFLNTTPFYEVDPLSAGGTSLDQNTQYQDPVYMGTPTSFGTEGAISLDGDYFPYEGSADFTYAGPLEVTSPDVSASIVTGPGQTLDLTWTPGGTGDVLLRAGDALMHLPDSGSYSYNVDDLSLRAPLDNITLILSRNTFGEVDAAGNQIHVQTASQQWMYLNYQNFDGWTELLVGDNFAATCTAAAALSPIGSGQYVGDVTNLDNNHDLGAYNPTTDYPTPGFEGVAKVNIPAGQTLTATVLQNEYDAAVYLLDDGCDVNSPSAGVDLTVNGEEEVLSYTASENETLYLVIDNYYDGAWFSLVLDIQ